MADKSVQTDPMHYDFSPLLEELEMQTNFLIENLEIILKSLEPVSKQNSTRSDENKSNEITIAGDVDSNAINCPALWSQNSLNCSNRTIPDVERIGIKKQENKSNMLKDELNQILECALKIKKAIPSNLQQPSNGAATDTLHMPTGVILTPVTQTEPIDTYVKFLQVIDEAGELRGEQTDNKNRSIRNPTSSICTQRKISNLNDTVDTTGDLYKPTGKERTANNDSRSSSLSLDIYPNDTLSRRSTDFDVTVSEDISDHTTEKWADKQFDQSSAESLLHVGSLSQRQRKFSKRVTADPIISTGPVEKNFRLKDYLSAIKQVHVRSPTTKRIREFSMRSHTKTYFDFDDYYKRLISMLDK